jgi:inositol hexakisphosphate/diphosphoinositol-pentakisphosphate kinase
MLLLHVRLPLVPALMSSKESHITTYLHLLLASGLPFTNIRIPELDYCSHCTIELWEKTTSKGAKDFSVRLSISEGAHSPAVLDSSVDARHSLTVQPRKKLTSHVDFDLAYQCFSKHFSKDLNFSTTPLEVGHSYNIEAKADKIGRRGVLEESDS